MTRNRVLATVILLAWIMLIAVSCNGGYPVDYTDPVFVKTTHYGMPCLEVVPIGQAGPYAITCDWSKYNSDLPE